MGKDNDNKYFYCCSNHRLARWLYCSKGTHRLVFVCKINVGYFGLLYMSNFSAMIGMSDEIRLYLWCIFGSGSR